MYFHEKILYTIFISVSPLQPTVTRSVSYFLEQGHWFLSLYNDDMDAQEVSFVVRVSQELTQNCPQGCNGRGQCVLGRCQCEAGYDGPDCGQSKSIVTNKMAALKCHLWLPS